jgi:predicted ATPase/DNA-binding SARP family transcriptional activator/class 3 adenylate cyclase
VRAEQDGRLITRFRTRKTAALLAYLALHPTRIHSREELVERFWPDDDLDAARTSLRTALASLRRQLELPGTPTGGVLIADRASIRLNPAAVAVDVAEFEATLRAAEQLAEGVPRIPVLARAAEIYSGELLPGFYDDWVLPERERLAQAYRGLLRRLAGLLEASGEPARAIEYARRAVAADPADEASCRELMRLLSATGEPAAALRQYHQLERILREEFGEPPSPVTRDLAEEIRRSGPTVRMSGGPVAPARLKPERRTPEARSAGERLAAAVPGDLAPPRGTVTFLLTDIAGSTALWEGAGEAFGAALTSHHAVLRRVFRGHGGYEAKEAGDSFLVAFATAADAVRCAVAAQRALAAQAWPEGVGPLKVRMALHTGDVDWLSEAGRGTYRGLALHHAARMLAAAHGGQILCSEIVARLLRSSGEAPGPIAGEAGRADRPTPGSAATGVELSDLGIYCLRDVSAPERLFQVNDPEIGRQSFPPLHAEAASPSHLPLQLTRFFGREREIASLIALLSGFTTEITEKDTEKRGNLESSPRAPLRDLRGESSRARLATLTGPGGSGKTRLAIEVAGRMSPVFGSAIWFVALADVTEAGRIPETIADALQIERSASEDPLTQVARALGGRPALLVIDNFEHLVEEGALVLHELLQRVPSATCLVTSRQRLNLGGEEEFPVDPLPVPTRQEAPERLLAFPSVRLFADRAQTARPDFQVTPRNAAAIAALCERLEGIPLALELAAARASMLTPEQMLAQLAGHRDFLVSRRRDIPARHRTLRAAVAWSVETLPAELRRFFALLSVFRGGWSLDAAEAVCAESRDDRSAALPALELLTELRERSLIQVEAAREARYRMLETLRESAAELLSPDENAAARRRHAAYYLGLAEKAAPLLHGPDQASWLDRLEVEHDNFRAALSWCVSEPDARELGVRLAGTLHFFWYVRGHVAEGRRWLAEVLATSGAAEPTAAGAAALYGAARLATAQGDHAPACALYEKSLAIFRALGDWISVARALCQWGNVAEWMRDRTAARALYSQSLAICRELKDRGLLAHVLKCLGVDAMARGDGERAQALLEESLGLYRELGNARGIAMVVGEISRLAISRAEWDRAVALLEEHLQLARGLKDAMHTTCALGRLGYVARIRGDDRAARAFFAESLEFRRALGDPQELAHLLLYLAVTAPAEETGDAAQTALAEAWSLLPHVRDLGTFASCLELVVEVVLGRDEGSVPSVSIARTAARLLGAAEALRDPQDATSWPAERAARERAVPVLRAALGEEEFAAAAAEGRTLTIEQAIEEAQRLAM